MSSLSVFPGLFLRLRSLVIILLLLPLIIVGCGGGSSSGEDPGSGSQQNNTPVDYGTRPVIKKLHIAVDTYDPNTGYAGDVEFASAFEFDTVDTQKAFMEFNGLLIDDGTRATPTGEGRLPHFTFIVPSGTPVYSMSDGIVMAVEQNPGVSDVEVRIAPDSTSKYLLVYDHLDQVTVSLGDTVIAGDQIAQATTMKVEADVTLDHSVSLCPVDFFDPSVAAELEGKLTQLMLDWEQYKNDDTLYDEAAMYKTACVTETSDDIP